MPETPSYSYQEIQTRIPHVDALGRVTRALEDRKSDLSAFGRIGYKHIGTVDTDVDDTADGYRLIVDTLMREEL
jgi:hypothetical protein